MLIKSIKTELLVKTILLYFILTKTAREVFFSTGKCMYPHIPSIAYDQNLLGKRKIYTPAFPVQICKTWSVKAAVNNKC